jgi:Rrf2 family protein
MQGDDVMQISSRFTVALHIFTCVETFKDDYKVTSDFLASSINTNPVIIRKILSQLKNAGLIHVARGTGGITLTRPLQEISFYDVYQAIEPLEGGDLFRFHEAPNPDCPVGRNIHALLDGKLKAIQTAMEDEMRRYTIADLNAGMQDLLSKEA